MLISQAIQQLQNITKKKITYYDIAQILGLSKQAIASRVSRNSELKQFEWEKLKEFFNSHLSQENNNSDNILIDYYSEMQTSKGISNFELTGVKEQILISKKLINSYSPEKEYCIIKAIGNSMLPSINDGDNLIIEIQTYPKIIDNRVYVFFYEDKFLCKRLILNIDKLVIMSDNQDKSVYPTQYIKEKEMDNIHILGKVIGLMRNCN